MKEEFRWIDNEIDISDFYDKLDRHAKALIKKAEQADRDSDIFDYYDAIDSLEIVTKLHIPDAISEHQWHLICEKYSVNKWWEEEEREKHKNI